MKTWERWPLIVGLLALWGAVFLAGLPRPGGIGSAIDDICYTDASLSLALTGKLQAPALERFLAPWHTLDYYIVPPFYNYLLAGWLAVFGIGTASLLAAYATCYFLASLALWRLLRGLGAGTGACLFSLAAFVPYVLSCCFRPEPVALPFLLGGLLLLARGGALRLLGGFLAVGIAAGCAVNLAPAAVALSLAVLAARRGIEAPGTGPSWRTVAACGALAILVWALLFAVLIRFRFHDFAAQFLVQVKSRRNPSPLYYLVSLTQYWRPLFFLPSFAGLLLAGALCCGRAGRRPSWPVRCLVWGCGGATVLGMFYRPDNLAVNTLFQWVGIFAFLFAVPWPLPARAAATAAAACLLILSQTLWIAALAGQQTVDREACARLRKELEGRPERLVVDDFAARYLFDFRLPPGTLDVGYLRPLPDFTPSEADKRPGEIWVCSAHTLDMYAPRFLEKRPARLRIFGHTFDLLADPGRIVVVP